MSMSCLVAPSDAQCDAQCTLEIPSSPDAVIQLPPLLNQHPNLSLVWHRFLPAHDKFDVAENEQRSVLGVDVSPEWQRARQRASATAEACVRKAQQTGRKISFKTAFANEMKREQRKIQEAVDKWHGFGVLHWFASLAREQGRGTPDDTSFVSLVKHAQERRRQAFQTLNCSTFNLVSAWRAAPGLGNHAVAENSGICIHPVYGFPILQGASIKGVARHYLLDVIIASTPSACRLLHPGIENHEWTALLNAADEERKATLGRALPKPHMVETLAWFLFGAGPEFEREQAKLRRQREQDEDGDSHESARAPERDDKRSGGDSSHEGFVVFHDAWALPREIHIQGARAQPNANEPAQRPANRQGRQGPQMLDLQSASRLARQAQRNPQPNANRGRQHQEAAPREQQAAEPDHAVTTTDWWEVDILANHHPDYYEEKTSKPSDTESPRLVFFLTVRPKVEFECALGLTTQAKQSKQFSANVQSAALRFSELVVKESIALWGIGAKTAASYGRLVPVVQMQGKQSQIEREIADRLAAGESELLPIEAANGAGADIDQNPEQATKGE
jgi:CRISPR/Cas system CMR subunit Cmr6 (Cas7 group RAMP superfamily)